MKYYTYSEYDPDNPLADEYGAIDYTLSEKEILDRYFPIWFSMMAGSGKELPPNAEQVCLDDWIVVNWATEAKGPE